MGLVCSTKSNKDDKVEGKENDEEEYQSRTRRRQDQQSTLMANTSSLPNPVTPLRKLFSHMSGTYSGTSSPNIAKVETHSSTGDDSNIFHHSKHNLDRQKHNDRHYSLLHPNFRRKSSVGRGCLNCSESHRWQTETWSDQFPNQNRLVRSSSCQTITPEEDKGKRDVCKQNCILQVKYY